MQDKLGMNEVELEITIYSGGRAGVHEYGWMLANYDLDDLESVRQQLMAMNDVGQVHKAMREVGIAYRRDILLAVKRYNFDSQGLAFTYPNYAAWRRLVTSKGTIGDAAYIIHEVTEVQELQRIQQQTGFDFMGKNFEKLSRTKRQQWPSDFNRYYKQAHSKALEAEYEFVTQQINRYINDPKLKITKLQAAAIDPTRYVRPGAEDTEAALHMFVDGVVMKKHHHFSRWRARATERINLSKATRRKLKSYWKKIRLDDLIMLVKNKPIK
jgi:hypothetical protein